MRTHSLVLLCALIAFGPVVKCDDVLILRTGGRMAGQLKSLTPDGIFEFLTDSGTATPSWNSVHTLELGAPDRLPEQSRTGLWHTRLNTGDIWLTRDLTIDRTTLRARLFEADTAAVSRAYVAALQTAETDVVLLAEDFEGQLSRWSTDGEVHLTQQWQHSGRQALRLSGRRAYAVHTLVEPLRRGALSLHFFDSGDMEKRDEVTVEVELGTDEQPRRVVTQLGWTQPVYGVRVIGLRPSMVEPVPRSKGWHQLHLQLQGPGATVTIDGQTLWSDSLVSGQLSQVVLRVRRSDQQTPQPAVIDSVQVRRPDDSSSHRHIQQRDTELVLHDGGVLFGRLDALQQNQFQLKTPHDQPSIPATLVREVWFDVQQRQPATLSGRLGTVSTQLGGLIHGAVVVIDSQHVVVDTIPGIRLRVPRLLVRRIDLDQATTWRELDTGGHHLGDNPDTTLPMPTPEGVRFDTEFTLPAVPQHAWVRLRVAHMVGTKPGEEPSFLNEIHAGGLRSYLWINGKQVAWLNQYIAVQSDQFESIRVKLPAGSLQAGRNTLAITSGAQKHDNEHDNFLFERLVLLTVP